jgi:hypothetical protein
MKQLTEDEFDEMFSPIKNQFDESAGFDGCLHETYGEELEYVRSLIAENRVVTIIEGEDELGDDGEMHSVIFYDSGYHFVNRLGYLILDKPYTEEFSVKLDW